MHTSELAFLVFIVGAFSLFGGVLGWASWKESRILRRKNRS